MRKTGNYKHGGKGTRLYTIWKSMRERCNNPNTNRAKNYHDKNILICDEWNDFSVFRDWALLNGYEDNLSIDRINNNLGYFPNNCRWATTKEQNNNRSTNVYVEYKGEVKTLHEWSEVYRIPYSTLWNRYKKRNWDFEKCLLYRGAV